MFKIQHIVKTITIKQYIEQYCDVERFVEYCKVCPNYGTLWCCPPYDYQPLERIAHFEYIHLIGTKIDINPKEVALERTAEELRQVARKIIREVRAPLDATLLRIESGDEDTGEGADQESGNKTVERLAFFAGSCHLCLTDDGDGDGDGDGHSDCARKRAEKCRHPERARPSLEAYGFDISRSCSEILGIELKWGEKGYLPEYYLLVSGMCVHQKIDFDTVDL